MKKNKKKHPEISDEESLNPELSSEENADEKEARPEEEETPDIELLQAENQKLREDYLRAFAEAENTKKRCAQEIEKNNKYAISSFAKNLLY